MQTAWKVQNETCCWFALRSLLDRKNNSHFYTFHSCLWRATSLLPACRRLLFPLLHAEIGDVCTQATSLLFDSCWHSATGYLTYYGYNSELFCKISNWNKNKVQALYGKAPPRGPTFYPFISIIFRRKVPLSYNNNNISFICVTISLRTADAFPVVASLPPKNTSKQEVWRHGNRFVARVRRRYFS